MSVGIRLVRCWLVHVILFVSIARCFDLECVKVYCVAQEIVGVLCYTLLVYCVAQEIVGVLCCTGDCWCTVLHRRLLVYGVAQETVSPKK
jgi:hypothetical protein